MLYSFCYQSSKTQPPNYVYFMLYNYTATRYTKSSRILGDVQAAKNGTLGKRVARRAAGKATGKLFRSIFK